LKKAKSEKDKTNPETAPYTTSLDIHRNNQNHKHEVGPKPQYLKNLLLPGSKSLRKDINAVIAFTASSDGKSYTPVGILVYGESDGMSQSSRLATVPFSDPPRKYTKDDGIFAKYEKDFISFFKKDQKDLSEISEPYYRPKLENNLLFRGRSIDSKDKTNSVNLRSLQEFRDYYVGFRRDLPSELQHRTYEKRTAEIFVLCAQSPAMIEYDKKRFEIMRSNPDATTAEVSQLLAKLKKPDDDDSWSSLLLSFGIAFMASERISVKFNEHKKWKPKFAAVVMKLFSDETLVKEAQAEDKESVQRGSQYFRNLSLKMGFTSQPIIKTQQSNGPIPVFKYNNPRILRNEYVSLHFPGKDYISLKLLNKNLPTEIKAENDEILGNVITSGAAIGICPSKRGMGIVKCS
jgi:hypothetical protein